MAEEKKEAPKNTEFKEFDFPFNGKRWKFSHEKGATYDEIKHVLSLLRDDFAFAQRHEKLREEAAAETKKKLAEKGEVAPSKEEPKA